MSDYQATLTTATTKALKELYKYRCAACLAKLPKEGGAHCAHWFDRAGVGAEQLAAAIRCGFVNKGFIRTSVANGMLLCPTCHLSYFTPNHIAFCPTIEVVNFLVNHCSEHPKDTRSIEDVLDNVRTTRMPADVAPFVDLFSLLPIRGHLEEDDILTTPQLPPLCRLQGGVFISVSEETNPIEDGVYRIFDAIAAPSLLESSQTAKIVFSSVWSEFSERRLWRLRNPPGVIYAYLFARLIRPSDDAPEVLRQFQNLCYLWVIRRDMDVVVVPRSRPGDDDSEGGGSRKRPRTSAEEQSSGVGMSGELSNKEGKLGGGGALVERGKTSMESDDSGRDPAPGSWDEDTQSVESFGPVSITSPPPAPAADYDDGEPPWHFGPQMTARDVMWILRGVPSW